MEKIKKNKLILYALGALGGVLILLIPVFDVDGSMQLIMHLVIMVSVYILLAQSWNILGGLTGLFSLGHAAFYGIGGYCIGIFMMKLGFHPLIGLLAGIILGSLFAMILGAISSRLAGLFFTISTIALGETFKAIVAQWTKITNSTNGLPIIRDSIPKEVFFYGAIALAVAGSIFFLYIRHSRFGTMFVAIRENQNLSKALGVSTTKYKTWSSVISAVMAIIAGAFIAYYIQVVDPNYLSGAVSNRIIMIVIIGGIGTVWGPILGSVIVLLEEIMRGTLGADYAPLTIVFYSVILIIIILIRPKGMVSIHISKTFKMLKKGLNIPTSS